MTDDLSDPTNPIPGSAKKRRGRPATGQSPVLKITVPPSLLAAIAAWQAKFADLDNAAALRALLVIGLHQGRRRRRIIDPATYRQYDRTATPPRDRAARSPVLHLVGK
jgi:hypothetical protein